MVSAAWPMPDRTLSICHPWRARALTCDTAGTEVSDCLCAPLRSGSFDAVLSIAAEFLTSSLLLPVCLGLSQLLAHELDMHDVPPSCSCQVLHHLSTEPRRIQAFASSHDASASVSCDFCPNCLDRRPPSCCSRPCEKQRGLPAAHFTGTCHSSATLPRRLLRPDGQLLVYCWSFESEPKLSAS